MDRSSVAGQAHAGIRRKRPSWGWDFFYLTLAAVWLIPVFWMVLTAFKPSSEIFSRPPRWIPSHLVLDHLVQVLRDWPFLRWFWNSTVISTAGTALSLAVSVPAAYAFARLRWPGRDLIFLVVLASVLIPWEINVIPLYFMMNSLGLLNTHHAVYLPVVAMPIGVFLLRQFFINIPRDLEDAARVDGAGHWMILWRIILPMSGPALAALAIYIFVFTWNEFFWAFIALRTPDMLTVPIGLKALQGSFTIQYGVLMAGSFLASLPVLVVFLLMQRHIIRGISLTGGIK